MKLRKRNPWSNIFGCGYAALCSSACPKRVNFAGATIDGLSFGYEAVMDDANFQGAKLVRADFRELMFGLGDMLQGAEQINVQK